MNVLFLDVDGVLNGHHYAIKNMDSDKPNIDENKVKILANICHKLNLKVVLSSSWKLGKNIYNFESDTYEMSPWLKYLLDLFIKYEIDFIGFTPNVKKKFAYSTQNMWKEDDIRLYLWQHQEVEHFVIIDDEKYDLTKLMDYVVLTNYYLEDETQEGLTENKIDEIKLILKKEHKYKKCS